MWRQHLFTCINLDDGALGRCGGSCRRWTLALRSGDGRSCMLGLILTLQHQLETEAVHDLCASATRYHFDRWLLLLVWIRRPAVFSREQPRAVPFIQVAPALPAIQL